MHVALVLLAALVGVPVGGFLNVVIDRVPDRHPLRGPRDGEAVPPVAWGPIPAQPWLLRPAGRAAGPRRWLWVELATAAVLGALAAAIGPDLRVVPLLVLGAALVAVSVIDLQLLRIPDRVTFPTLVITLPLVVAVSAARDELGAVSGAVVGSVAYFVALLVPHLVYPRGMGFGDVKLALLMGLHLGWLGWTEEHPIGGPIQQVLYALMLGCLLGAVFGIAAQLITKRRGEFPFGPALAVGCLVVLVT